MARITFPSTEKAVSYTNERTLAPEARESSSSPREAAATCELSRSAPLSLSLLICKMAQQQLPHAADSKGRMRPGG